MKEAKTPKKPLIYYYGIVLLVLFLFNLLVAPLLAKRQVKEVDYGTFMSMIEQQNIGVVEVDDAEIIFTDKENTDDEGSGSRYRLPFSKHNAAAKCAGSFFLCQRTLA